MRVSVSRLSASDKLANRSATGNFVLVSDITDNLDLVSQQMTAITRAINETVPVFRRVMPEIPEMSFKVSEFP